MQTKKIATSLTVLILTALVTACSTPNVPGIETAQPQIVNTESSSTNSEIILPAKNQSDLRKSIKVKLKYAPQGFSTKAAEELSVKAFIDRSNDGEHKEIDLITVENAFSFTITASQADQLKIRIEVRNSDGALVQKGEIEFTVTSDTNEIEIPMENINVEEKPPVDVNVAGTIPKQETSKPSDLGVRDNNKKPDSNPIQPPINPEVPPNDNNSPKPPNDLPIIPPNDNNSSVPPIDPPSLPEENNSLAQPPIDNQPNLPPNNLWELPIDKPSVIIPIALPDPTPNINNPIAQPAIHYFYQPDKNETYEGGGTYGSILHFMLSGNTFIVEKKDGSAFQQDAELEIKVGTFESWGVKKGGVNIQGNSGSVRKEVVINFNETTEQWENGKAFYCRITNAQGGISYAGPIIVYRKAQ